MLRMQKGRPAGYRAGQNRVTAYEHEVYFRNVLIGRIKPNLRKDPQWLAFDAQGAYLAGLKRKEEAIPYFQGLITVGTIRLDSQAGLSASEAEICSRAQEVALDLYYASREIAGQYSGPKVKRLQPLIEYIEGIKVRGE